jgi:hypothetical protein
VKSNIGIVVLILCSCCSGFNSLPKYGLVDRYYQLSDSKGKQKVYAQVKDDSIEIFLSDHSRFEVPSKSYSLSASSFDIDVITEPFKYRPGASGFPRQVNASFNGNVYVGYRIDKFKIRYTNTPGGTKKEINHLALTGGTFAGFGATFVSPWTTNYQTLDEYEGLVLSRGFTAMIGLKSLTFGLGVGWDFLTDRDKSIWIYQNKPWYGVTIGLSVN